MKLQKFWGCRASSILLSLLILNLTACATSTSNSQKKTSKVEQDAAFDSRVGSAMTSPLSDLNIVRIDIPEVLINARKAPYLIIPGADCPWYEREIQSLNEVLGPDIDAAKIDENGNIVERELGNATINALKSFTEGFVPFRSWVRRLTGADSHTREVAAASIAGIVRRSYLKGIVSGKSCLNQAADMAKSATEISLEKK
ncbi:hypothetical protein [Undibacterium sp. Ji22W]|uniref:hypothetical protein n=1 Tax=Undibacterium sp. Ji22W TaxID=3413038 RepID=UPI003BF352E5